MHVLIYARLHPPSQVPTYWSSFYTRRRFHHIVHCDLLCCVDGFANGHVRMGVGFVRIRLACESMRVANPHHRINVPTPRRKCLWWHGDSHNIKKACDHCRIRANPLGLRIHASCESPSQVKFNTSNTRASEGLLASITL